MNAAKLIFSRREEIVTERALLAVVVLAICSKITIPIYPVPITMQMLAVYLIGLTLNPRESFAAVGGWMLMGIAGIPVFATATASLGGPTSGYIFGMLIAAPAAGLVLRKSGSDFLACLCAYIIVHLFGCAVLSRFVGLDRVMQIGFYPFIVPEVLKMTTSCILAQKANKIASKNFNG
jgi:biotin transport system substrate-specific component